jgi:hypothetical protein
MAQLMALGNFPSYIKTVIYSWPGGSLASYPSAQTICAPRLVVPHLYFCPRNSVDVDLHLHTAPAKAFCE